MLDALRILLRRLAGHADGKQQVHHHPMPRPPDGVVDDIRPVMFADHVDCARLAPGTEAENCD